MRKLRLSEIQFDGETQMRAELDLATVADYREELRAGTKFPPIVVFFDGSSYWIGDGYHRWHAAAQSDHETIECDVRKGTKRDAILHACGANGVHGLRRTNPDKHRAVMTLLNDAEWSQWSNRVIAEKCGVSDPFVMKLRDQLLTVSSSPSNRRGADGKVRKRPKKKTPISPSTVAPTPPDDDEFFHGDDTDVVEDDPAPEQPKPSNIIGEFRRLFWDSLSVPDRRLIKVFILEEMGGD